MSDENQAQATVTEESKAAPKQEAQPEAKKKVVRRRAAKRENKAIFVKSKRKRAVARASAKVGKGRIRLNGFDINVFEPIQLRRLMLEPVYVSKATQEYARGMDVDINVYGGGMSSQAQAVRGVIAKAIAAYSSNGAIRSEYLRYDRFMIIDDARRVEPKKFKGPKARARFQKSYR